MQNANDYMLKCFCLGNTVGLRTASSPYEELVGFRTKQQRRQRKNRPFGRFQRFRCFVSATVFSAWPRGESEGLVMEPGQTFSLLGLAPATGFEPVAIRLTVECSTAELRRNSRY